MGFLFRAENVTEFSSQKRAVARYEGRTLDETKSVQILWSKGIQFSSSKGKARRQSPLHFLKNGEMVPHQFRNIVLTNHSQTGIKCWGRIDFLVKYCGYRLIDERS